LPIRKVAFANAAVDGHIRSLEALHGGQWPSNWDRDSIRPRIVYVAPASPTRNGKHVLADIDTVINSLRVQGSDSVAPVNLVLPFSRADPSGHAFQATYFVRSRAGYGMLRSLIS
jgi:hypothetical protein